MFVNRWQEIIQDKEKSWVLFRNGTCVIFVQPEGDLVAEALALIKQWGPVQIATPSADFNIIYLTPAPGWIVTCHHQDILTYVDPAEMMGREPNEILVGLFGRSKRDQDAKELEIIHVEDRRAVTNGA